MQFSQQIWRNSATARRPCRPRVRELVNLSRSGVCLSYQLLQFTEKNRRTKRSPDYARPCWSAVESEPNCVLRTFYCAHSMSLLKRVGDRIRRLLYLKIDVEVYRAPLSILLSERRVPECSNLDLRVVVLDRSTAEDYCEAPPAIIRTLRSYFTNDTFCQYCLMAFVGDSLAGWSMLHIGAREWPLTETGTSISLGSHDAVFYSAFTVPEFRGARINRVLMLETAKLALANGARSLVAWHVRGNEAPRRNMTTLGMTLIQRHSSWSLFGNRLRTRQTGASAAQAHG